MALTLFKIAYERLETLNEIIKGNSDPSSPRHLTDAAKQVPVPVEYVI